VLLRHSVKSAWSHYTVHAGSTKAAATSPTSTLTEMEVIGEITAT